MIHRSLASLCLTLLTFAAQAANVALPNPGFEEGDAHWHTADNGMSKIIPEAARSGKLGLRVVDTSDKNGSDCHSDLLPATPGKTYALFFWARALESVGGVGVYLQFFDAAGHNLNTSDLNNENILVTPDGPAEWKAHTLYGKAPQGAATRAVWIHAFDSAQGKADLDDFSEEELSDKEAARVQHEGLLTSGQGFPLPAPKRIDEIAAWLQPLPHGLGRPASDRKAWSRLTPLPEAEGIVRKAVSLINKTPPELPDALYLEFSSTGNRSNYERPYFLRTGQIDTLLLAECLEYKGRFLPALERTLLAVCDERS